VCGKKNYIEGDEGVCAECGQPVSVVKLPPPAVKPVPKKKRVDPNFEAEVGTVRYSGK
jgi:hypothetical protein